MANPVGFRFRPTDGEIVDIYLRPKNLESNTSHVDEVISTVDICSFDPWDLPSHSRMKTRDQVWYFFGRKENKYGKGDRQIRKTKSGFWKKTGVTMDIMRKTGDREKIGEKRVLVFKNHGGSKSDWAMHEYHATFSSPNQIMTYTLCKVKFKGERREFSVATGSGIKHTHSLIPPTNNSGVLSVETEGSLFHSQESQNPSQFSGFLDVDALDRDFCNILSDDFKGFFNDDDEQSKIVSMQDDRNNHTPQKPLTGVFSDHSTDGSDSDPISATTISIQTLSTCPSFGSSNPLYQITDLQESPNSIKLVSLAQEVSKTPGTGIDNDAQGTEIGEHKLGQETIKNKRAGFFHRMIQKFVKKIHLRT
ncbi:NAC domain-containing protein 5 [Arabidopsis thaliana]|uniref:NAC domain-containing protein 5 n=3 Tax=Arabidopsis TaxID=3701 RepID=NAC5_ARATH|eukprot:NP_171727.2 NAC domain containing protein 5 [Arabidopsis thaliana]